LKEVFIVELLKNQLGLSHDELFDQAPDQLVILELLILQVSVKQVAYLVQVLVEIQGLLGAG